MSRSSNDADTERSFSPSHRPRRINHTSPGRSHIYQKPRLPRRSQTMNGAKDPSTSTSTSSRSGNGQDASTTSDSSSHNPLHHHHHRHHHHSHNYTRGHNHAHFSDLPPDPPPVSPPGPANGGGGGGDSNEYPPPCPAHPFPHAHPTDPDPRRQHNPFNGYTYQPPNYPETHWSGLSKQISRTSVVVGDNSTAKTYTCRTDMIRHFLPNCHVLTFGREWSVFKDLPHLNTDEHGVGGDQSRESNPDPYHLSALNCLFRAMQEADRTNHFDLFATSRYYLRHNTTHVRTLDRVVLTVGGLGEALSWDQGLGCNDVILDQIETFVLELIEPVRRVMPPKTVSALVLGIGYIWRPDDRHRAVLKTIWDGLDGFEKEDVTEAFRDMIQRGRGMSFSRMLAEMESL